MDIITGATGHIGNVLTRDLLSRGSIVKALVLPNEDLTSITDLDVEKVTGDVCDERSLEKIFYGADVVYHLAGIISIMPGDRKILEQVNVIGTRNVIEACFRTGVRRLVYVSSIHAVQEPPHGTVITETCAFNPSNVLGEYAKSKAQATCEVLKAVERGLDAVIVCPTGVIGPYDYRVSEMGKLIVEFMNRKLIASVKGAYDFVDVRDVANGIILAGQLGRRGETYILSGERIEITQLMSILTSITGIKAPKFQLPSWLARYFGILTAPYYKIRKIKPLFTSYSIDVLTSNSFVSSAKAKIELGFSSRSIRESIEDAVQWFIKRSAKGTEDNQLNSKRCLA
jgi:dihydroflavonol-4-reductase